MGWTLLPFPLSEGRVWKERMSLSQSLEEHMRLAIQLSIQARQDGNHPFGAVLVDRRTNKVLLKAKNTVNTEHDCTRHAELNLMSAASRQLDDTTRHNAVLFTSCEPCFMCCGAIFWAGVSKVVYGLSHERLESLAGKSLPMPAQAIFARGSRKVEVEGPILEEEAQKAHDGFWKKTESV